MQIPSLCKNHGRFLARDTVPLSEDPPTHTHTPTHFPVPPRPLASLPRPALTHAGHACRVQAVAVEAVAGKALGNAHAAAVGAAVQDPTFLGLQPLVGSNQRARACREHAGRSSRPSIPNATTPFPGGAVCPGAGTLLSWAGHAVPPGD